MSVAHSTALLPILAITNPPPASFTGRDIRGPITTSSGERTRWTCIGWFGKTSKGGRSPYWWCRCECGTVRPIIGTGLLVGNSLSCGCLNRERVGASRRTHGCSSPDKITREYKSWRAMKKRCYDASDRHYENYGARGITICEKWRNDFSAFLNDLGPMPENCDSIDRFPNQDGNYEPGNCRWSNRHEQSRNTRSNVMITWDGRTQCLHGWAKELGVNPKTFAYRYRHWTLERTMTTRGD